MKKAVILKIGLLILLMASTAGAAVFTVTPTADNDCSDYQCDLQSALTAAASNSQNDTINIAAGTYNFTSTIRYVPTPESGENFSIVIAGAGNNATTLDCGSNAQALLIDTTALSDSSQAGITLNAFQITGTGNIDISTSAGLSLGAAIETTGTFTIGTIVDGGAVGPGNPFIEPNPLPLNLTAVVCLNTSGNNTGTLVYSTDSITVGSNPINIQAPSVSIKTGRSVTLDVGGIVISENITIAGQWKQVSGPPITLSNTASKNPYFVAPPVANGSNIVTLEYAAINSSGAPITFSSAIAVTGNGITGFPSDAVTFKSVTDRNMGMRIGNAALTRIATIDPGTVAGSANKPSNMIYGLLDMEIKTINPGDTATVTVFLPAPAPAGYKWFKYNDRQGWYDFSDHAVFNADRTQITLTLVDGGVGDDDGVADGVIKDPSGLGTSNAPSSETSSGGGGGGCFIATAAYGSAIDHHVATLRAFRDRFLLTNYPGREFVKYYYKYSPPVADFIAHHDNVRFIVRWCLLPAIGLSVVALKFGYVALLFMIMLLSAGLITYSWRKIF
jgi:hypothetical protein